MHWGFLQNTKSRWMRFAVDLLNNRAGPLVDRPDDHFVTRFLKWHPAACSHGGYWGCGPG